MSIIYDEDTSDLCKCESFEFSVSYYVSIGRHPFESHEVSLELRLNHSMLSSRLMRPCICIRFTLLTYTQRNGSSTESNIYVRVNSLARIGPKQNVVTPGSCL